jgi:spore germination protein YaaH
MCLPFYGRAWADKNLSKAYRHSSVAKILTDKSILNVERREHVPYFEYEENVKVQVYFEDVWSTLSRVSLYGSTGIDKIAFWRVGQEDPKVWTHLQVKK